MDKLQKQYFREIKRFLPCNLRTKQQYLKELSPSVNRYIQQNDGLSYDDLCIKFGSPQDIAEAYLVQNPDEISHGLSHKRHIFVSVAVVIVIFLLGCFMTARHISKKIDWFQDGYYITEIESDVESNTDSLPEPIVEY